MKSYIRKISMGLFVTTGILLITAHVGSPGVIFEGDAGPYKILVNINPPDVIPGTAQVQVYINAGTVTSVKIKPNLLVCRCRGFTSLRGIKTGKWCSRPIRRFSMVDEWWYG